MANYERLRRCVLSQTPDDEGTTGVALLLRRGLRAWLEGPLGPTRPAVTGQATMDTPLGNDWRGELTRLVATMALSAIRQEVHT